MTETYSCIDTESGYRSALELLEKSGLTITIRKQAPLYNITGIDIYCSSLLLDEKVLELKNLLPEMKVWGNKNNETIYIESKSS